MLILSRRKDETIITVEMIRRTIANLHAAGIAALPYLQVSGDGDFDSLALVPVHLDIEGAEVQP